MNAQQLIEELEAIALEAKVPLERLEINYRYCYDSDVDRVRAVHPDLCNENDVLDSVCLLTDPSDK